MTALQTFWTWIFGLSVALFFLVEIVVVIGGAGDIRDMLRELLRQAQEADAADDDSGPAAPSH